MRSVFSSGTMRRDEGPARNTEMTNHLAPKIESRRRTIESSSRKQFAEAVADDTIRVGEYLFGPVGLL